MIKVEWKRLCNFTKHASGKRRLTKKELGELMDAQIALQGLIKPKANFIEANHPKSLTQILAK